MFTEISGCTNAGSNILGRFTTGLGFRALNPTCGFTFPTLTWAPPASKISDSLLGSSFAPDVSLKKGKNRV